MSDFLQQMQEGSAARLREAERREPLAQLRLRAADVPPPPALRLHARFDVIAELKLRSPALGALAEPGADIAPRVRSYAAAGACAVSVLTEPSRFDGQLAHLGQAAAALAGRGVPVMRKDFLVDPYQLYEARAAGAGGVLLIVRMLSPAQLGEMIECATELGLFVLLECFDAGDIEVTVPLLVPAREVVGSSRVSDLGSVERTSERPGRIPRALGSPTSSAYALLGINCRDLKTLEVVPRRFAELAPQLPPGTTAVAESGIESPADCTGVVAHGYRLALVGGALMRAEDPGVLLAQMLAAGRAA